MEDEIWKPVVGFESSHEVSNKGNVRGLKRKKWNRFQWIDVEPRQLKMVPGSRGYIRTSLGRYFHASVHRLVAIAFIPNPLNLPEINHKDGNKSNNNDWNLEWATHQQNIDHANRTGLVDVRGEKSCWAKLTEIDVVRIRHLSNNMSQRRIAGMFGVNHSTIGNIIRRKKWKHI